MLSIKQNKLCSLVLCIQYSEWSWNKSTMTLCVPLLVRYLKICIKFPIQGNLITSKRWKYVYIGWDIDNIYISKDLTYPNTNVMFLYVHVELVFEYGSYNTYCDFKNLCCKNHWVYCGCHSYCKQVYRPFLPSGLTVAWVVVGVGTNGPSISFLAIPFNSIKSVSHYIKGHLYFNVIYELLNVNALYV